MSNIVCQVESQPDRIAFTWSQGKDSFAPYHLCGDIARNFADLARELRVSLADVVTSYLEVAHTPEQTEVVQEHRRACLALAQTGHKLYKRIFNPGKADKSEGLTAGDVSKWLKKLQQLNDLTRLEIVHKGTQPLTVPWNLVYDCPPDEQAFLAPRESPNYWRPFWGIRYDLSGGKQVDPLRRMPWWSKKPRVWMVVDHDTVQGLPEDQRHALDEFRQQHGPVWIESAGELKKKLASGRPDLMYWLCHADPNALYLDGEPIRPRQLLELLENDDIEDGEERTAGLVFLNACQTAEGGEAGSFAETFHSLGMCGMIATEHQTIDTFASPFGLDFLDAFLTRGEAIGPVLQRLRGRVPLGLLYAAYCPPDIRVLPHQNGAGESIAVKVDAPRTGTALGPGQVTAEPPSPLPEKPYCSLRFYDREDRALFAGRDGDVRRFARLLDDPATRLLVLHGESGVGKSSFLRAGVLPYLEDECVGYHFLRDRSKDEVLFVRATNDLTCQLADAIHRFCAKPFSARTPEGETATIDLPALLRRVVGKETDVFGLSTAFCDDPSLLSRLLAALSEALPFTVLLVIDQGEEVFTLARNESDAANRRIALQILREAVASSGDFKLIVSLRTEYYGRFVDRMRRGAKDSKGVREYLLTDFDEETLAEVVRRPTSKTLIPHAKEVPFEKFNFSYAEGVPEALAREVITYTTNRQDSALPLLQVICSQLYERAAQSPDHVVRLEDLESLGRLKGGMRRHVYGLVARLFPFRKDREAFRCLLTGLYLRQPDGALTTALMPADELANRWQGRMPFEQMLQAAAAGEWRLLRVTSMRLGGEKERRYISLGHDALAQVAAEWDEEFRRGARLRRLAAAVVGTAMIAVIMAGLAVWALSEQGESKKQTEIALKEAAEAERSAAEAWHHLYNGQMELVRRAESESRFDQMRQMLAEVRPRPGQRYLLTFEWYRAWRLCHRELFAIPDSISAYSPDGKLLAYAGAENTVHTLDLETGKERAILTGHTARINALAFSPEGRTLASGGDDKIVRLWDVETGKELATLTGHPTSVNALVFSPDSHTLASGGSDETIRLWDVERGKERAVLEVAYQPYALAFSPYAIAFSPDSKTLASASRRVHVRLWDVGTGKERAELVGHTSYVSAVTFSPDGRILASGGGDGTVRLWDVAACKKRATLNAHSEVVNAVAFAKDGRSLVSAGGDGNVRIWNVEMGTQRAVLAKHAKAVIAVAISPDGRTLASASIDQTVQLWDLGTCEERAVLMGHTRGAYSLVYSPDGNTLAARSLDGTVRVWDLRNQDGPTALIGHTKGISAMAFSPDGKTLASASYDSTIRLWDAATRKELLPLLKHAKSVYAVAFSPDSSILASTCMDNAVYLWDVRTRKALANLTGYGKRVSALAFSPDGKTLACACGDQTVRLWDIGTRKGCGTLTGHSHLVHAVAFSPDGKTLASAGYDRTIRMWNVATGKEHAVLNGHNMPISSVAFSPDGKTLASAASDQTIRLWDPEAGTTRATLTGHTKEVNSVGFWVNSLGFSPDDKTLASAGFDTTVRLWDVETGKERAALTGHTKEVRAIAWSPDNNLLASGGFDQTVRLWTAATDQEVLEYSERHAVAFPDNLNSQTDFVLACWSLYLRRDRRLSSSTRETRFVLEKGHAQLLRLQEKRLLSTERLSWIKQFEAALRELSAQN